MNILFTFGIDEEGKAQVMPDDMGAMNIYTDGSCNAFGMMDLGPFRPMTHLLYGPNATQPAPVFPEPVSLVFNQVSEPDSHKTALQRCTTMCEVLGVPVVNHPNKVLATTRDGVSQMLQDIPGVRVPRSIALTPSSPEDISETMAANDLQYPVLIRMAGSQKSDSIVLLTEENATSALHAFPLDGRRYYLTEYVDYADENGVFFKHRVAVIGGEATVRQVQFSDQWQVNKSSGVYMLANSQHGSALSNTQHAQDTLLPRCKDAFKLISERVGLDYFGVDCHINNEGEVLLFTLSAATNFLMDEPTELTHTRDTIEQHLFAMLEEKIAG